MAADQDIELPRVKVTSIFQFKSKFTDNNVSFNPGKSEVGFWVYFNNRLSVRYIYKVYSDYSVKPFDMYANYKMNGNLSFRLGQFRTPSSMENMTAPFKRDLIDEALVSKLIPTRDYGVGVDATFLKLSLNAALINGNGFNRKDDNSKKDGCINIDWSPTEVATFGFGSYLGANGPDTNVTHYTNFNFHGRLTRAFRYSLKCESSYLKNEQSYDTSVSYLSGSYFFSLDRKYLQYVEIIGRYDYEYLTENESDRGIVTLGATFYPERGYASRFLINYKKDLINNTDASLTLCAFISLF